MAEAGDDRAAFLGVSQSLTGQRWFLSQTDDRLVHALAQRHGLPDIVARVLAARGVALESADDFLNPTLRKLLPDPSRFLDLEKAAERVAAAIINGEQIAIFGDYDVDGATSSALLARFFRAVGAASVTYIPDRIKEGYGPNAAAFEKLKSGGAQVVVTVDCGTTAYDALEAGQALGLDVIVADHHQADGSLPPSFALINPNRPDEADDIVTRYGQLAAVGVAFLLVVGINRVLRAEGWYQNKQEPNPLDWLDLVALGTVCDVVPLTGINRALVSQGLKVMGKRRNPGIQALAAVAGLDESPGTYHAGFVFGPRVNAGGRVGRSDMGARLLSTDDPAEATALAQELDAFNDERKAIEAAVQEEAMTQLVDVGGGAPIVIAAGEGWHPGVIGIVASRIKDKTRRPTFVIALNDGLGKGSGRSIPGVDLGAAVTAAAQAGLLVNGGGHKMAAGLTVKADQLDELKSFLTMHLAPLVMAAGAETGLRIDASLAVAGATPELIERLEQAGPFGSGHREPRFALPQARLISADIVGENHVRCIVGGRDGGRLKAIAFRSMDGPLGPALLSAAKSKTALNLAGHLRADRWMGRLQAQLLIDDAAPVMQPPDNAVT